MIQVNKTKDKVILTLIKELDIEDVKELVSDLQDWILESNPPTFKGIDQKAVNEAFQQAQSKRKLEDELRRCFVDLLDSEYIKKELQVYELDPISKEVITKSKKLSEKKSK